MVRILSNGDIVPDDDPRANQSSSASSTRRPEQTNTRERRGVVHNVANENVHHHMPQTGSMFDTLNERLRAAGVPKWHLGPYPVEPIVSLGLLIALLLLGFKGLILGLLLFFVSKWSQSSAQGGPGQGFRGWRGGALGAMGFGGGQDPGVNAAGDSGSSGATGRPGRRTGEDSNHGNSSGSSWSGGGGGGGGGGGHRLGRS